MAKKATTTTTMVRWDEELAAAAEAAAAQEASTGGGQFFSLKAGKLSLGGNPIPDNRMAAVILDWVLENVYYEDDYDPEAPASPVCYAFGRDETALAPHDDTPKPQHAECATCEQNQWGSAARGKGKACKNRRRLALVSAGTIAKDGTFEPLDDPEAIARGPVAYLALPPTSLNGFGAYVKQLAGTLRRPPYGVATMISLESDPKTQFKVVFETLDKVPEAWLPAIKRAREAVAAQIEFPYQTVEAAPAKKAKKRNF